MNVKPRGNERESESAAEAGREGEEVGADPGENGAGGAGVVARSEGGGTFRGVWQKIR